MPTLKVLPTRKSSFILIGLVFLTQTLVAESTNSNVASSIILNNVVDIEYLIKKRKKIGITDLSSEQPDFTLIHPDSIQARIQRYLLFSYANHNLLSEAFLKLQDHAGVLSVVENSYDSGFLGVPIVEENPLYQLIVLLDKNNEETDIFVSNYKKSKAQNLAPINVPSTSLLSLLILTTLLLSVGKRYFNK